VTLVALKRVVDRLMFRPTIMRTSKSRPRGEGEVAIDPARFGIEGHVNDLPKEPEGRAQNENLRRLSWRLVRAYRRTRGHRVCLERAILRDKKNGATHTKRKRAGK